MFKPLLLSCLVLSVLSSDYKSNLLGILKLEYESSQSLESVNSLLSEISSSLRKSQETDDKLQKSRSTECMIEVTFLDRPIEVMFSEITRSKQIVSEKEPIYNHTKAILSQKTKELDYLNKQIVYIDNKYKEDSKALQDYYFEHEEALKAVSNSLLLLKSSESSVTSAVIQDNSQHIEIVGSSFLQNDQDSFTRLVDVFTDIKHNIEEYLKANTNRKVEIDQEYKKLKAALEEAKSGVLLISKKLDQMCIDLAEDIEEANRMTREAGEECGSMVRAKKDKETECGAWTKQYDYETNKRNEEISIIIELRQLISKDLSLLE